MRPVLPCLLLLILTAPACGPRRYFGRGLVLEVDRQRNTITLSHERIDGYMEPMVMPFNVRKGELLENVVRGEQVHFRLAVHKKESYLDHLMVVSGAPVDPASWQTTVRGNLVALGEAFPDFQLTNQHGQRISLSSLRGQVVAVNFIYTRCPLPDYCPRMTGHFSAVRRSFPDRLGRDLTLLTITLDPGYDTPEVLRKYARAFGAEAEGWHFLTGTKEEIDRVCALFGIEYWPDSGMLTHNLQTALIDRNGILYASVEGKDFTPTQLTDLLLGLLGVVPR